jgi:hypothetical protein
MCSSKKHSEIIKNSELHFNISMAFSEQSAVSNSHVLSSDFIKFQDKFRNLTLLIKKCSAVYAPTKVQQERSSEYLQSPHPFFKRAEMINLTK